MNRHALFLIFAAILFCTGCENVDLDMYENPTSKVQEFPRKWKPDGAIPFYGRQRNYDEVDGVTIAAPDYFFDIDAPKRGKKLFDIFCGTCHGVDGKGKTPVGAKLDKKPADLSKSSVRVLSDGEIFVRALTENTPMPGHRNELTDEEAWDIVARIREIQGKR